MASLAKWGALSGLGMGISQAGEAVRQQWLLAAQQEQQEALEGRREARQDARDAKTAEVQAARDQQQHARSIELEDLRHRNTMERDAAKPTGDVNRMRQWTNEGYSYLRDENGDTFMMGPGETSWTKVAMPGEEGATPRENPDLRAAAEEYAKARVNEMAGWASTDKSDFKAFGGSREQARQHFINQYIESGGNPDGSIPDLDTPPSMSGRPQPAAAQPSQARPQEPMSGQVIRDPKLASLPPDMLDLYRRAKMAIDANPANRDEVVRRLKAAGIDDATLQTFGF